MSKVIGVPCRMRIWRLSPVLYVMHVLLACASSMSIIGRTRTITLMLSPAPAATAAAERWAAVSVIVLSRLAPGAAFGAGSAMSSSFTATAAGEGSDMPQFWVVSARGT